MTKLIVSAIVLSLALPAAAHAAWWNPFSWKTNKTEISATTTLSIEATSSLPSTDELYKRIAELEAKLDEAREALKKTSASAKTVAPLAPAESKPAVSSVSQIALKAKRALVLVETATSSTSGFIFDKDGYVLAPAHGIWVQTPDKSVIGAVERATIVFSDGTKKSARLVGLHELSDVAVLKIMESGPYSFIPLGSQSSLKAGDKAYVASTPSSKGGTGGEPFLAGTVSKTGSGSIEVTIDEKPLDNGGAILDASGTFVGIPNPATCKVLEEMKTCLRYAVTSNSLKNILAQVREGMRLYRDKSWHSAQEDLVRGQLDGVYGNTRSGGTIDIAVLGVTGKNSFDFLNNRLGDDKDGKIAKIYVTKLKIAAENIYSAFDFLKNQSYAFRTFLINESSNNDALGDYQKKVLKAFEIKNAERFKDYQAKVDFWSKKKNEYDSYLTHLGDATHDYLMTEAVTVEDAADYLMKEKGRILDDFSGDAVDIF